MSGHECARACPCPPARPMQLPFGVQPMAMGPGLKKFCHLHVESVS